MKYVQPYGISDADAPYINGDPSIARQGSIPPAAAFEHPMREIVAVIQKNGLAPDTLDLLAVGQGHALAEGQFRRRHRISEHAVGRVRSADYQLLTRPAHPRPLQEQQHRSRQPSMQAPVACKSAKPTGAQVASGDLTAGGLIELVYDGAAFQMINFGGAGGGTGSIFYYNIPVHDRLRHRPTTSSPTSRHR